MTDDEHQPLICHRCGKLLQAGRGDHYLIRIDACADPTPQDISLGDEGDDSELDLHQQMKSLLDQMSRMSEQELMDQVHRRLIVHLCRPCYTEWIQNPTG